MTAPTKAAAAKRTAAAPAPRPRAFLVGTQPVIEGNDYDSTFTVTNGATPSPWALQATGWLRGLHIQVTGTGLTGGTATADAPFNIFANLQLNDVNSEAIYGPFDGYSAFVTNKYGGYMWADDPATNAIFNLSGTTSTNNFTFVLYIPMEFVKRDPIGAVASVNNTASLTVVWSLNPTSTVFTSTTGTLAVRIQGTQDFYWEPKLADKQGHPIMQEPPASGTTQYWTQGSTPVTGGALNQPIGTGLGYPWRCYGFLYRDSGGSRANGETNWPTTLVGIKYEANFIRSAFDKNLWKYLMSRALGHTSATADTRGAGIAVGKENGMYWLFFNDDFAWGRPGSETRRSYLQTSTGSNWIVNGSFGTAGNLYSLVNYVAPGAGATAKNDTRALTGGH